MRSLDLFWKESLHGSLVEFLTEVSSLLPPVVLLSVVVQPDIEHLTNPRYIGEMSKRAPSP